MKKNHGGGRQRAGRKPVADRIQIKHDTKPNQDVITLMKKNGFKWSPFNKAWQRQITANAIYTTKHLINQL